MSLCPKELVLKPDGSVSQKSPAVRRGDVCVRSDGSIDRASKWVKNGYVIVKADGNPEETSPALHRCVVDWRYEK
jgi:hypothetical protein